MLEGLSFHFVRHAPVMPHHKDRAYGADACADLNDRGSIIATRIALPSPEQALWISSGMRRAIQTAYALLNAPLANPAAHTQNIHSMTEFNEQSWGDFADRRHASLRDFPETQAYAVDPINTKPPKGENIHELLERVNNGLHKVAQHAKDCGVSDVVIISHQWVIASAEIIRDGVCPLKPERFTENPTAPLNIRAVRFGFKRTDTQSETMRIPHTPLQTVAKPALVRHKIL